MEHPLQAVYNSYTQGLQKVCCFGKVMIALKEEASPEDAEVLSISRLAREANMTEADIMSSIRSKGFLLITPEEIWGLLDRLKEDIEAGKDSIKLISA